MKEVKEEVKEEEEVSRDSGQALLVYAVAATVFTVRISAVPNMKLLTRETY